MTREEWLKKNGVAEIGTSWLIGGDTYQIKDWLKEQGCKFNNILLWHSEAPLNDLPADYYQFPIDINTIAEWNNDLETMEYLPNCKETIKSVKFQYAPKPAESAYYPAEPGSRVKNITAIFESKHFYLSQFGKTNIYTFKQGSYCFVWFTQTEQDLEVGNAVDLTFTIKGFELYRERATTLISRCKIIKI